MKVGSLFSGIGGMELGLERTGGFKTAWFVEREPYARAVLAKQWPNVPIYEDVRKVSWLEIERVDVLTGGFPCQDISNAGKRAGIKDGTRSGLWKYFAEAIGYIRPKYVIVENVAAITQRELGTVLADLASLRYDAEWHCIPAASVGAPHRRDRIFIIAYPNSIGRRQAGDREFGLQNSLADSGSKGLQGHRSTERIQEAQSEHGINGWWTVEPDVGRVANGVSFRVDRIRCLGNAIVPQVAQIIGQAVLDKENFY